jgi:hypothetical protein
VLRFVDDLTPVADLFPSPLALLVVPPLVVVVAAASYYGLERPALSLKRLVSKRDLSPDQPGAVSTPALPNR